MWIAYKTIVIKEVRRFIRIWIQTIVPPVITTSLYLLIFGGLMGGRIGQMQGIDYIDFIVPGIILMTVIMQSYANTVSSFFMTKYNNSFEELLVSTTPNWIILLGFVSGGIARGFCVGLAVTFTISFFVEIQIFSLLIIAATFLLTSIMFALAGFINAVFARTFDDISIIPNFVLLPLTYLGGMFYSIDILPSFWRALSAFNPIYYMMDAFRLGFLGVGSVELWKAFLVPLSMIIILALTANALLNRGVSIKTE
ncbi:MAG: ABC transporter permease [Candidatus Pseudothioglobus sp.]|jgi:ABC-2 type transport system permease protein|tara:strand:- start:483 stop:1244 length:762 start_codon:yes stop_codon:yes gene_type:complete